MIMQGAVALMCNERVLLDWEYTGLLLSVFVFFVVDEWLGENLLQVSPFPSS